METLKQLYDSILKGRAPEAVEHTGRALEECIEVDKIVSEGMNTAMEEVGSRFSRGEIFLPEMMVAARAMKAAMAVLEPRIVGASLSRVGKIVLGTAKDDLHDIGKNLVSMMFQGAGFEVVDLGVDVPKERFLEVAQEEKPQLIGISALLTTVLPGVKQSIAFLRENGLDPACKILVGGAPVTQEFANREGADGYAKDAGKAISIAKELMNEKS
jgi:5-methyltetrahydrofolate--homocysteine methyltransferase